MNTNSVVCPTCKTSLTNTNENFMCPSCATKYEIREGIPIFTSSDEYWCNVERNTMMELIRESEESGDWHTASKKYVPDAMRAYEPFYRADAQFIFPINSQSRVLDAGSMWGGLTIPIAQYCKEIVALDKTWETLRFLKTRASQMGIENITPIVSPIKSLPFPDHHFDLVMLNGVLEWVGMEQDVVVDEHWDKKRTDTHIHQEEPRSMQLAVLKELRRVVKPGGAIFIAIENRIGVQYYFGHPDDHMNVRFITFMPRWYANFMTKLFRNSEYRTYVYTPNQLSQLIREANFNNPKLFSIYPYYQKISRLTPFGIFKSVKTTATEGYAHILVFCMTLIWRLFPSKICMHISPSIALIADATEQRENMPRLIGMLIKAGIISSVDTDQYELMMVNNRFDNGHSVNYAVFDKRERRLVYFCKISRRKGYGTLNEESDNLEKVSEKLSEQGILNTIPKLLFCGEVDSINIQVTKYMDLQRVGFGIFAGLRRIDYFLPERLTNFSILLRPLKYIGRKVWLWQIDKVVFRAIEWLATFQNKTKSNLFNFSLDVSVWLDKNLALIKTNNISVVDLESELLQLKSSLETYDAAVPLCIQHGDFDLCNLLEEKTTKGLRIVDFEHMEIEQLPFYDLGNLIFSPLLAEWKDNVGEISLKEYAKKTGWSRNISRWLDYYSECSGISRELLSAMPGITVIEQNAKQYPENRDPYDYPLYGDEPLKQMLGWRI